MTKFNAYQAWLGIPPEQQPPHHYRLLGIEFLESDPTVIERGADRQMTYIRTLKLGQHVHEAERLLTEISQARLCLLDPPRKARYDAQLRQQKPATAQRSLRVATPLANAGPTAVAGANMTVPAPATAFGVAPVRGLSPSARRRRHSNLVASALGYAAALLLLAGGLYLAGKFALQQPALEVASDVAGGGKADKEVTPQVRAAVTVEAGNAPGSDTNAPIGEKKTRKQVASAEVDLPFIQGEIGSGQKVLSDRDYVFGKVDPQLTGLGFTKLDFGAPGVMEFQTVAGGNLYLILPPIEYAKPLPAKASIRGWTTTDLQCEIIVDGKSLPCVVLQMQTASGFKGQVPDFDLRTVWPILAAKEVLPARRVLDPSTGNAPEPDPHLPGPPPLASTKRIAPPVAAAAALLREEMGKQMGIADLPSVDAKLNVSRALVSKARDAKTSSDERYVALTLGAELAADAAELTRALDVLNEVEVVFAGSTVELQLNAVRRFTDATAPRATKVQQLAVVAAVIERAISAEKFGEVDEIVQDLLGSRLTSPTLGEQRKRARRLGQKYNKEVIPALKVLKTAPGDPAANHRVGDYLAVGLQDWPRALPFLAKGDDVTLARVAKQELANPQRAEDQLAVAQGWRLAVDKRVGEERGPLMLHAEEWYHKAWPGLPEGERQRAREQLGKLQEDMDKMKWPAPTRKVTIYASCGEAFNLAINGKVVLSGVGPGVRTLTTDLNAGDIILVQAQRSLPIREGGVAPVGGGPRRVVERYSEAPERRKGFACAIVYEGSTRSIATGVPGSPWTSFVTKSAAAWELPEFIDKGGYRSAIPADTSGGQQELIKQSQTNVLSIWGGTSPFEAYFACTVP